MEKKILTRITKSRQGMFTLYFDEGTSMAIYLDLIAMYKLSKGCELSHDKFMELCKEQNKISARRAAYTFASYKMRTEAQVRQKLKEKKFEQDETDAAINKLYELEMLDDEKYARIFTKEYSEKKKAGPKGIITELRKRGVKPDSAKKAVENYFEGIDETMLALEAAERKLKTISYKTVEKQLTSVRSYLIRKGFKTDTIRRTVNQLFKEPKENT